MLLCEANPNWASEVRNLSIEHKSWSVCFFRDTTVLTFPVVILLNNLFVALIASWISKLAIFLQSWDIAVEKEWFALIRGKHVLLGLILYFSNESQISCWFLFSFFSLFCNTVDSAMVVTLNPLFEFIIFLILQILDQFAMIWCIETFTAKLWNTHIDEGNDFTHFERTSLIAEFITPQCDLNWEVWVVSNHQMSPLIAITFNYITNICYGCKNVNFSICCHFWDFFNFCKIIWLFWNHFVIIAKHNLWCVTEKHFKIVVKGRIPLVCHFNLTIGECIDLVFLDLIIKF